VRRSRYQSRTQLVLELKRPNPEPAVERGTKGVVETLADLLLEALGGVGRPEKGGVDEHQDHA
jgi:hypothetical protein